jgi:quercetin dioxygenase-like cupin family protein
MKASITVVCAVLAGGCVIAMPAAAQQVVKLPNEIEFKAPLRPGAPPAAVVYGDPNKPGLYVVRVKFAPGFKVLPHFHPDERTVVVLSGTFHFGLGEQWEEGKMKAYPPGTFLSEPPKVPHYSWAKDGEVIIQVTGVGPSGSTVIPQSQ